MYKLHTGLTLEGLDYILIPEKEFPKISNPFHITAWLFKHPWITCQRQKPKIPMAHVAYESKIRSIERSSMH